MSLVLGDASARFAAKRPRNVFGIGNNSATIWVAGLGEKINAALHLGPHAAWGKVAFI